MILDMDKTSVQNVNRDFKIDFLRALSIILIIMAHIKTNQDTGIIFQLRSFDVPLMCMLVGMTSYLSFGKRNEKYGKYLMKRFKRLIIPMWIFVSLYLVFSLLNKVLFNGSFPSILSIVTSYIPIWGIGYVWIIRVYFTIAIVTPAIYRLSLRFNSIVQKTLILFFLLAIHQILCYIEKIFSGFVLTVYQQIFPISSGYIIIALIGMWVIQQKPSHTLTMFCFFGILCGLLISYYGFDCISSHKYPPDIYYISYGVAVSLLLYLLLGKMTAFSKILGHKFVFWISSNSLEMYYWHIFFAGILCKYFPDIHWSVRFIIVIAITIVITYFQLKFIPGLYKGNIKKGVKK